VFFVYTFAELHLQFPVVTEWFDSLAVQPAFVAGVEKVGLSVSAANSCSNSCSSVASTSLTEDAKTFLGSKWNLRKNRTKPL